jgi:proline iminopeptidase
MSTVHVGVSGGSIVGWREGTGDPALVLHGGPGLSDYTAALARELTPGFETIRYQQRGLQPSLESGPFDIDTNVADAIALLDALSIKSAWLVGHSWGGLLAMHVAVASPERVRGLMLIDSAGAVGDGGLGELDKELGLRYERYHGRAFGEDVTLADLWPFYFSDPHTAPPMPPMNENIVSRGETFTSMSDHYARRTLSRGLPHLAIPAVFVHGLLDPLPASVSVEAAALIPNSTTHLLEECGHFPWIELPGRIREIANVAMARS